MKILQLNFEKSWRGGERQTLYCMQAFRNAGHEVELLARAGAPLAQRAAAAGFTVHGVRNVVAQVLWLACHAGRFDIVHAQTANTVTWAVLTKPVHRRPVVFSRRTSFVVKPDEQWKTGFKWRHVDLFVAISEMAAAEPRRLGLDPLIIRSAVAARQPDLVARQALSEEFALSGRRVLGTSAALITDKDPLTLIEAVALMARLRQDFVFLHFGGGGDQAEAAHARVRALGLQDVFRFAGFRQGVEDFYGLFDVFVMASQEEALGSSVFDAFLQGVPVVSTDAGGLKESLADGRGLLCPVGDPPALACAMSRMLDDAALRESVVQHARVYAETELDIHAMGGKYLAAFERLLSARG